MDCGLRRKTKYVRKKLRELRRCLKIIPLQLGCRVPARVLVCLLSDGPVECRFIALRNTTQGFFRYYFELTPKRDFTAKTGCVPA
jgi:hypothetical protein